MRLLLVAATLPETALLCERLDLHRQGALWQGRAGAWEIDLLITGVGMVNTAFTLGRYLAAQRPDLAINVGIAGTFDREMALGTVVEVVSDFFPELGAESPEGFLDMEALGFPVLETVTQRWPGGLNNPSPSLLEIPKVSGATVNTVHGVPESISALLARCRPQVETMEGAAFFHAMLASGVPFLAFRGISNYVEPRNRAAWQIGPALRQVQELLCEALMAPPATLVNSI
ncbi:MAG: futalosine hydrolase [Bacteroidetes bacterium]|nr:MAG: futalosine hydrolase [Bacteroidota bacterium]